MSDVINEFIVSRITFKHGVNDPIEDKLYIAELVSDDRSTDNVEIAIRDSKQTTHLKFRLNDLIKLIKEGMV